MANTEEEQGGDIPEWVVTFGDMMSLLLTFFVLLFSMSEVKEEQQLALIQSLRRQFGHTTATLSLVPGPSKPTNSALQRLSSMGRAHRANTMNGGDKVRAPVGDYPPLRAARSGDQSTTGGVIYFQEGQSDISDEHRQMLENIAEVIGGKPQKIEILGHASAKPLKEHSPYVDHYDLGYARAFNAMQYLVDLGIDRRRIRVGSAGKNEPATIHSDQLAGKEHDRVEVWVMDEFVEDALPQTEGSSTPFTKNPP